MASRASSVFAGRQGRSGSVPCAPGSYGTPAVYYTRVEYTREAPGPRTGARQEGEAIRQSHLVEKGEGNHSMAKYDRTCQEERGILSVVRSRQFLRRSSACSMVSFFPTGMYTHWR